MNDNALADDAIDSITQNAGWNQVQDRLITPYQERMPGIMATLKAHNGRDAVRQEINNLAFALIAPLGANNYNTLTHFIKPNARWLTAATDI